MTANFAKFHIREWELSYYNNATKKWLYGSLQVTVAGIIFTESKSTGGQNYEMFLDFGSITEMKKCTTSLIFSAIVIITDTATKHWFSSLPNRDGIFNVLCYFKRCQLLPCSKYGKKHGGASTQRTKMGTRLLNIATDSQKTLQEAAENLHLQGSQIDSALSTMSDLHNDLDVADNLVSGLESWFGRWTIPEEYKYVEPMIITNSDLTEDLEFEVLYTKLETGRLNTQNVGLLRICKDGLYILTEKQKLVHHFGWKDISRLKVVSLWEINVIRYLIGKPDLCYSVVFTSLFTVLKILDKQLRSKVEYPHDVFSQMMEPSARPKDFQLLSPKEQQDQLKSYKHKMEAELSSAESYPSSSSNEFSKDTGIAQTNVQIHQSTQIVGDQEVKEISNILSDLKCLALDVQKETDVQNEKLDRLNDTVEHANTRLVQTEKRVHRIT